MDKFKNKFLEEAADNILELEDSLLKLEKRTEDKDLIEKVFRAMHSIKGGASMFGFSKLSDLTHQLETIWDLIRADKMQVTQGLVDLTLQAIDHLKSLLQEKESLSKETEATHRYLIVQFQKFLKEGDGTNKTNTSELAANNTSEKIRTYYIHFEPFPNIFDNGTNPLFLLDEL